MPTLPTIVQPGDVISSDLMNAILAELARLGGGTAPTGTQLVPNLFGNFLGDARAAILAPSRQLAMGSVLDVGGAAIDPIATVNVNRIVLNQHPSAGNLVTPGTPVSLVVSGTAASPETPAPAPTISGTETLGGNASSSFAVGSDLLVVGTGFSATGAQNSVTFNGISAAVTPAPDNPTRRLIVRVPTGIPGAPAAPGDPDLPNVTLSVRIGSGEAATATVTLAAPSPQQPSIDAITPSPQFEGQTATLTGSNLDAGTQVRIEGIDVPVVDTRPTQIDVTVPDLGLTAGVTVRVSLAVSNDGASWTNFGGDFRVRTV